MRLCCRIWESLYRSCRFGKLKRRVKGQWSSGKEQADHCNLFLPTHPYTGTPCRLRVGVALRHPQGSHTLRIREPGFLNTMDKDPYVASSSRYLPTRVDSCTGHYTDRILRIDHM
jgi:hypothetical protein